MIAVLLMSPAGSELAIWLIGALVLVAAGIGAVSSWKRIYVGSLLSAWTSATIYIFWSCKNWFWVECWY